MPIQTMQEKFLYLLGEAHTGEQQLLQGYEQMLGQVGDERLRDGIQMHVDQSRQQVQNLEQIFRALGQEPQGQQNGAAEAMVADAQRCVSQAGNELLRDVLVADAGLKMEHFEIGGYRGLLVGAQQMGQTEAVDLLQQNLQQEEQMAQQIEQLLPQLTETAMAAEGMGASQGA